MIWLIVLLVVLALSPLVAERLRHPVSKVRGEVLLARNSHGAIRYRWFGSENSGSIVVLVHGLTTPSQVFDAVADRLAAKGFRVLTYDLYGRGASDRPGGKQNRAFFVRQLRDLLADQRIEEPVALVGYSMGGVIATAFAAHYMERVDRLVLLASAGLKHNPDWFSRLCISVPIIGDGLMMLFGGIALRRVADQSRDLESQVPDIADVMAKETHIRGYLPAVLSSLRHTLAQGDSQARTHGALGSAGLPVLGIWGAADRVIPLEARDLLASANPSARHYVVADAGHGLAFSHPEPVAREIAEFLRPVEIARGKTYGAG